MNIGIYEDVIDDVDCYVDSIIDEGFEDPELTFSDIIDKINGMNLHKGTTNSLIAKINSASDSVDEGEFIEAINTLNAFTHQVNAQVGKKISSNDVAILLDCASEMIDILQG